MSVKIALTKQINMDTRCCRDVDYAQCKGFIEKVTTNDELESSRKLQREVIEETQFNVTTENRELHIIVADLPRSLSVSGTHNLSFLVLYGEPLEKLGVKYPNAELSFNATYSINGTGRFDLSEKLTSKCTRAKDISNIRKHFYGIPSDASLFLVDDFNFYLSLSKSDTKCSMTNCELTLRLPTSKVKADTSNIGQEFTMNILAKSEHTDFSVVANDGTEFKCHKCFLTAHSEVLKAMLREESRSKESLSGRLEIDDMSKEGVQALLEFLYSFTIKSTEENSQIALELLRAGHKYNIGILEESMKDLFLSWPLSWSNSDNVEVGLGLFRFVRNIDGYEDLKIKSIEVLKKNSEELLQSESYLKLFKEDLAVGMELCAAAFVCGK